MDCPLQYIPLNKESKEIRVLRLIPGAFDDDIRCQLSVTSVHANFEALSYVWGDATTKHPIEINGRIKEVTQNLECALRYLRDQNNTRTLWVDAVCINQDDLEERKHQVRMMDIIYQEAERIVVWLGAKYHENALPAIKAFGKNLELHWDPKKRSSTDTDVDPEPLDVFSFLRNPWFRRIWTLQEAVLAKSMTYIYGMYVIPQSEMEGFLLSFARHIVNRQCCKFESIMGFSVGHAMGQNMSMFMNHIDDLVKLEKGGGFLEVAPRTRHRQATDPRDKVFGLLGLVNDLPQEIIDYKNSISFIYSRTAFEHIKATGYLDVLSHVLFKEPDSHDLPSWVPDWSDSGVGNGIRDHLRLLSPSVRQSYNKFFKACQDSQAHPSCPDSFQQLNLEGYIFDKIIQVGDTHKAGNNVSPLQEWRKILNVDRDPERPYVTGSTNLEVFWRTLCISIDPLSNYKTGEVREISENTRQLHDDWWWEFLKQFVYKLQNTLESGQVRRFTDHFNMTAEGRRLVVSQRGYIGLASEGTRIDDEIWLLCGGRVPHILRSSSNGSSLGQNYTFVSDSYIHGIMNGEYWEEVTGNGAEPTTIVLS